MNLSLIYSIAHACFSVVVVGHLIGSSWMADQPSNVRFTIGFLIAFSFVLTKYALLRVTKYHRTDATYPLLMSMTIAKCIIMLIQMYLGAAFLVMEWGGEWFRMPLLLGVATAEIFSFFAGWNLTKVRS